MTGVVLLPLLLRDLFGAVMCPGHHADATQHVDVVLVSLQGLLVDVEAEVPPVLVSAGHGLNELLSVLREVADPKKKLLVMTE